jgi:hypothetical protein
VTLAVNILEIPLSSKAQVFTIDLNGVEYKLSIIWNSVCQSWILDVRNTDDTDVLLGIPLVTGRDLLEQFKHLNLGGNLLVQTDTDTDAVPTFNNLGTQGHLYYITKS